MNTDIYKDKRAVKYFQKARGLGSTKAKQQAMLDITEDCEHDPNCTRNYISIEYIVLLACSCNILFIQIKL
jgi:hypothetical protein